MGYAAEILGIFYSPWDYQMVNILKILKSLTWHRFDEFGLNDLLLNRFNKTQEIFPSVTWVLSILLTTAATSVRVERVNTKECVPNNPCSVPATNYVEMWALCSSNPANV